MSKRWNRTETWLALAVIAVGMLLTAILGLHLFMTGTGDDPRDGRLVDDVP